MGLFLLPGGSVVKNPSANAGDMGSEAGKDEGRRRGLKEHEMVEWHH